MAETLDRLRAILYAIHQADRFTEGMSFERFASDTRTVYAVVTALEIAGEGMKNVSGSVRSRYHSIPWQDLVDLSEWLIHRYHEVTPDVVWNKAKQVLPAIEPHIAHALEEEARREDAANG